MNNSEDWRTEKSITSVDARASETYATSILSKVLAYENLD